MSYLRIKDFALVEDMEISFYPGLNVLTGETGAGKSILINAISLLIGDRASTEMIRQGAEKAYLEAIFHTTNVELHSLFNKSGLELTEDLIVSREIANNGRSICRINGTLVPVSFLREIGAKLVDMHGQFQHQFLLSNENQLYVLDEFNTESKKTRKELVHLIEKQRDLAARLQDLGVTREERDKKIELLNYQINEIEEASLTESEEEDLKSRLKVLANLEKLLTTAQEAYYTIYEGDYQQKALVDMLSYINKNMASLLEYDDTLKTSVDNLKNAEILLIDAAREIKNYTENLYLEPGEKERLEERLQVYRNLKQKYGNSVEGILAFSHNARNELAKLHNNVEEATAIEKELTTLNKALTEKAAYLTKYRQKNARQLKDLLHDAFKEIDLDKGKFDINFLQLDRISESGKEKVEFLFSANSGEPLLPLKKIISGGEMSRIMLALKSVLAGKDNINTLIFDEIDSGIGGIVAQKVSHKLKETAKHHQIVCVTHNPQIAAKAQHQYLLFKESKEGRTYTRVKKLDDDERINEIARMLDGSINDLTLAHARSLLSGNS